LNDREKVNVMGMMELLNGETTTEINVRGN
jgi:hypothetical protein